MRLSAAIPILLVVMSGCTATRLRDRVVNQTGTLTDLQYKQVLGNLARLHVDPYAIPSQSNLHDGTAQVQANAGANITLFRSSMLPPSLNGSRTLVEQWTVRPVTDDNALKLLRLAYQRAIGMPVSLITEEGLANDLAHALKKQIAWPESEPIYSPGLKAKADPNQGTTTPAASHSTSSGYPGYSIPSGYPGYGYGNYAYSNLYRYVPQYSTPGGPTPKDPVKPTDDDIKQDIANSMRVIKLSGDYFAQKYKTSNSEDIVFDEELGNIDAFQPGKSTVTDGVISGSAREVRRQVKEVEKDLLKIQPGWVHFGHKPPHDAFYFGRYGATYAWVDADHGRELAEFTLIVLNLSDLIKENTVMTSPGGIRFAPTPTH